MELSVTLHLKWQNDSLAHLYHFLFQYFSNSPISGILSETLSLYESLDKKEDPAQTDEEGSEEERQKEHMYKFVQKLLNTLTLAARALEEYKTEEEKKVIPR